MQATGDLYGDMFEISNFRKEDIANITDPSGEFVEVLQCHNASKGPQSRGHQYAGAFLYKVFYRISLNNVPGYNLRKWGILLSKSNK